MLAFFKKKSIRNSAWIIGERLISVSIGTLLLILSARYLGTENYGILSYGASLAALFLGVMRLGLDSIMVNELIRHKDKQGEYLGTSIVLRLAAGLISIIAVGILLLILNAGEDVLIAVALIQSLMLMFQAFNILDYWFQSRLKSKYVSFAKIVATVATASYGAYLLISGKSVVWFAASIALTSLAVGVSLVVFYKKQGGERFAFSLVSARKLLGKSQHFIIANIIAVVYVQIDKMMIGNMLNSTQLGIYSAALVLVTGWAFLPDSIITSMRPIVINAKDLAEKLYLRRLKQLYFIIFWLSVVVSGALALIAPFLMSVLFGAAFESGAQIVQIIIWYVPLSMLGIARNIWLVSERKHQYAKYILIYGVITNVGLNLILIPKMGIAGAALATVVTELVTCFIAPLLYKPVRGHVKIVLEAIAYRF